MADAFREGGARRSHTHAPEAHPIVPGTGGVRKARWGRSDKVKSGGVRAIYYFHGGRYAIYMLAFYSKSKQSDLTQADKRELKSIVTRLKGGVVQ